MSIIDKAGQILNNGYQVAPITSGLGKQPPLVSGHLEPETEYTELDAKEWSKKFQGAGLALCGGKNNVYALDFDIDDKKLSGQLYRAIKKNWSGAPIRQCNHPRFAVLFKAKGNLLKYANAHSKGYKTESGELNQIELIGGRIITLYGKHRKTGKSYKWSTNNPTNTNVEDLPELSLASVKKLFKFFEDRVPKSYKYVSKSTFSKSKGANDFDSHTRINKVHSEDQMRDILDRATGNDRTSWRDVGMALHHHYNGSKEGLHVWDEWSSQFRGYEGLDDCRYQWKSFKTHGGITLTTIEKRLPRKKKVTQVDPEDELQEMLENWAYIARGQEIGVLTDLNNESMYKYVEAEKDKRNKKVEREVTDGRTGKPVIKPVRIFDLWFNHPDRITAYSKEYIPMNERLITPDFWEGERRKIYYNSYVRPNLEFSGKDDLIHHFVDHIKYIFPGDNWKLAMNWMAQIVQKPFERHRTALYSICTNQGTGRGWVSELLGYLYGAENVSTIGGMDEIVRPGAKNGYLYETVLCIVNEVSCRGNDKYKISDRLKTLLSDDRQAIDLKWGKQKYNAQIYTRMFLQANSIGDMIIDEDDARITVCINHSKPKEKEYYVQLYKLLDKKRRVEFLNQVYTYLSNWNVNISFLQEAPITKDKHTVIRANKSDTALAFYEFKLIARKNLFTNKSLNDFIAKYNAVLSDDNLAMNTINKKQLEHLQKEQILTSKLQRVKGKLVRLNSFADHDLDSLSEGEIVKSVTLGKRRLKQFFIDINTGKKSGA